MCNKAYLPYGRGKLEVDLSAVSGRCTILERKRGDSLREITVDDLHQSFEHPTASAPLRQIVRPEDSVCIVTSDGTRPFLPMRFMLHAVIDHLSLTLEKTTILPGSGSHWPHTEEELQDLFCRRIYPRFRVVCHDSRSDDNVPVGRLVDGSRVTMNRHYLNADKKIVLGHIEPHIFAGFTGGPKGIAPAICGIETIHRLHSYDVISDPSSCVGEIENNTCARVIREAAAMAPPDFLVNVVLDKTLKPVAVVSGDYLAAHREGVEISRAISEVDVPRRYPIVVTTNGGHPLDQNLYQTIKGLVAGHTIAEKNGTIIIVSECARGVPSGSAFEKMLTSSATNETLLSELSNKNSDVDDRWQVQRLLEILAECRVILVSSLDRETTRRCRLEYAETVEAALEQALASCGGRADIGVLPDGPSVIPNLVGLAPHGLGRNT